MKNATRVPDGACEKRQTALKLCSDINNADINFSDKL